MQRSVLTTLAIVAVLGVAWGVLMLSRSGSHVYTDDLSDPVKVADSYVKASILNDLERAVFYWTGDREAYRKSGFGRVFPSLPAVARRNGLPLEDYRWRLGPARVEGDVAFVRVELETIQTGKIARKVDELLGISYTDEGKVVRGPRLRPDLTVEEAEKLARSDPSVGGTASSTT
ncbi:MAG: hypothetical protein C4333_00995 [Meiothermus sp.]